MIREAAPSSDGPTPAETDDVIKAVLAEEKLPKRMALLERWLKLPKDNAERLRAVKALNDANEVNRSRKAG